MFIGAEHRDPSMLPSYTDTSLQYILAQTAMMSRCSSHHTQLIEFCIKLL